jgi:hypothetical protein
MTLRADSSCRPAGVPGCARQGKQGAAAERLALYWRACGVVDESRIQALCQRVWQRLARENQQMPVEDLLVRVIQEATELLDDVVAKHPLLREQLGGSAAIRAAMLADARIDWSSWLLAEDADDRLDAVRRALPRGLPAAPAPLSMEKQRIERFELRRPRALSTVLGHFSRLHWSRLLALMGHA